MKRSRTESWRPQDPAPPLIPGEHPASAVEAAIGAWQRLCDDERKSVSLASLVLADLAQLGAPAEVMGAAAGVVEDEIRHVEVCATVVRALGGTPAETPLRNTIALPDEPIEQRAATLLVAGFAAGEPLSAAAFAVGRRRATEPLVAWAYTELLRDEMRHGAFGARAGAWVMREWRRSRREALWPACVEEMERFEARAGGTDRASDESHRRACERLGMVSRSEVQQAIVKAIPRWILPNLATLQVLPGMTA
jgi:hypothetical protein